MKYLKILLIILLSNSHLHSDPLSPLSVLDEINNVLYNKKEKDFKNELGRGILSVLYSKEVVKDRFSKRCGCSLKGSNPNEPNNIQIPEYDSFSDNGTNIPLTGDSSLLKKSPNFYNNILLGDSITQLGTTPDQKYTWNKDYAPGWGIVSGGVGMATSQDLSEWLDTCASQNTQLWTPAPEQLPCENNPLGRFSCNPPPNADKYSGYVQFQNRNVFVMIGGNDFNVGLYKTLLETFPVLVPFRHNHVANQLDRIMTGLAP